MQITLFPLWGLKRPFTIAGEKLLPILVIKTICWRDLLCSLPSVLSEGRGAAERCVPDCTLPGGDLLGCAVLEDNPLSVKNPILVMLPTCVIIPFDYLNQAYLMLYWTRALPVFIPIGACRDFDLHLLFETLTFLLHLLCLPWRVDSGRTWVLPWQMRAGRHVSLFFNFSLFLGWLFSWIWCNTTPWNSHAVW